jgi:hypothetical protein
LTSAAPDFATGRPGDRFNRCKLMPHAERLAKSRRLQTGLWFRRNTKDCQEMEQQKHDDNFCQKNVLH